MILAYLAAPLFPIGTETLLSNIHRAKRLYKAYSEKHTDHVFLMPWLLNCEVFSNDDEAVLSLSMQRNFAVIDVCHEIWLVGPRISRGMAAEAAYARAHELPMRNFTDYGRLEEWTGA